jgi:hypothetical protein
MNRMRAALAKIDLVGLGHSFARGERTTVTRPRTNPLDLDEDIQ